MYVGKISDGFKWTLDYYIYWNTIFFKRRYFVCFWFISRILFFEIGKYFYKGIRDINLKLEC